MPDIHLKYGGSTAARTLACPAWPRIVAESPKRPAVNTTAAMRGTELHAYMECLYTEGTPLEQQDGFAELDEADQEALLEAERQAELYLDSINCHTLLPEQFVQFAGDVGGSADLIAIGDVVAIMDWKFGYKPVTDTAQFKHYAICARVTDEIHDLLYTEDGELMPIESVIIQPACNTGAVVHKHTLEELDEYQALFIEAMQNEDSEPTPGDHCAYCKAAPYCPARRAQANHFVSLKPTVLSELTEAMELVEQMKIQIRDVEAEVFGQLEAGNEVPGWKLVMKQARRYWKDAAAVLEVLKKSRKVKHEMYITETLKSPAQVEKSVGKLLDLSTYMDNKSSGTTLAPASDKRPAVVKTSADTVGKLFDQLNTN